MRISDWSSDVCSSDLTPEHNFGPAALSNGIKVTPLARRLAAERSIDLATVAGSGPNGRIVADDIRDAEPPVLQVSAAATSSLAAGAKLDPVQALYADTPFADVELDAIGRASGRESVCQYVEIWEGAVAFIKKSNRQRNNRDEK